jgi:uncharacterized protein (TIGR02246 family)
MGFPSANELHAAGFLLDFTAGRCRERVLLISAKIFVIRLRKVPNEMPVSQRPKLVSLAVIALTLLLTLPLLSDDREAEVRRPIQAFYKAFDEGFTGPADYATEDWNHINPSGGRDRDREATLKTVRAVHQSFLKGTTDTVESMDIRFASREVAVGTVTSVMSPFTAPDGVKHGRERHIRTFVVVKRNNRWLIMQDHNTMIAEPH